MADHTLKSYDTELTKLDASIAEMGAIASRMLTGAMQTVDQRDGKIGQTVITADAGLDALQKSTEDHAIDMIARRQPVADDLRRIISSLRIASELERVGDLAKNIAKRATAIGPAPYPAPLASGIRNMAELASDQLGDALAAYAERSAPKALEVWRADERIDGMYNSIFRELLTYMMEDQRNIGPCTHLLFVAKNIERIGDHATNIAETIHFLVTGNVIGDARPKGDLTSSTLIDPIT